MRDFKFKQTDLTVIPEPEIPKPYDHGYDEATVAKITQLHAEAKARDLKANPITLEEFKNVVVPFLRINRTEAFNIKAANTKVPKVKIPKEVKVKEPKVLKPKKLTKKFIESELSRIIMSKATGVALSEADTTFFSEHTKSDLL